MKFQTSVLIMAATLAALAGCASAPSAEEIAAADYGREASQADCTQLGNNVIARVLKDPDSAQFRGASCEKGYWASVPIAGLGKAFGWMYSGEVNAKNSYGGYAGYKPFRVLIRDGRVIRYCLADADGMCMPVGLQ